MFQSVKKRLYFFIAAYFRFFAQLYLLRWRPRIIVLTGSIGKTTLLHLLEAQLGSRARYSHQANSSFGVPFDILGLKRNDYAKREWLGLFFLAPFKVLRQVPQQQFYVIEADCDRIGEGKFLASFLKPEIVLWLNVSKTHAGGFDHLVKKGKFSSVEKAITHEFAYYIEHCSKLAIVNGDDDLINEELFRSRAEIKAINKKGHLEKYQLLESGTIFQIDGQQYRLPFFLAEDTFYALSMSQVLLKYLGFEMNNDFTLLSLPPGRNSLFIGKKNIKILDSSYNASLSSMKAVLALFNEMKGQKKWAIIGDMIELGSQEKSEHEKLAELLSSIKLEKLIFIGPRVLKYTYPRYLELKSDQNKTKVEKFFMPKEVLDYLLTELAGGETLLFKGARFLEGVIEHLLSDREQVKLLCRREKIWQDRRKKWEL